MTRTWLLALAIVGAFGVGLYMTELPFSPTRLQLYNLTAADDFLANAVVGWSTGENEACPDLTTQW